MIDWANLKNFMTRYAAIAPQTEKTIRDVTILSYDQMKGTINFIETDKVYNRSEICEIYETLDLLSCYVEREDYVIVEDIFMKEIKETYPEWVEMYDNDRLK